MSKQALLDELLRTDFLAFMHKAFATVSPGDQLLLNWHHEAIAWQLLRAERGECRRLVINIPPRGLKTIMVSIAWVAWLLGQDPTRKIVGISYSADLSLDFARKCRRIMETDWYRRVFPSTRLQRSAQHDFETTAGGGRFSTSIDGTLTGRGGDIIILDDPMKTNDTHSEAARRRVTQAYREVILSRLNNPQTGVIVLVMQRLHDADLSGYVLEEGGWDHLALPVRAFEDRSIEIGPGRHHRFLTGDFLEPDRWNEAELADRKKRMGSASFSAQLLQQPIPADGILFSRNNLRWHNGKVGRQSGDKMIQVWDTASKAGLLNDWSVCITAIQRKNRVYVLDVFREKLTYAQLKAAVLRLARQWNIDVLLVEDAASGTALLQQLWNEEPSGVPSPIRLAANDDKQTRFYTQTARIEAGDLVLPEEAPWQATYLHELLGFPHSRHDDQVDATAHLLQWTGLRSREEPPNAGPILYDFYNRTVTDENGERPYSEDEFDWSMDEYIRAWGAG